MSSRLSIANLLNGPQPEQDLLAEEVVLAPHLRKQPPPTPRYDPVHDLGNRARPPSPVVDDTDINQVLSDLIDESPAPAPQSDTIDDEILSLLDPTPGPSTAPAKKQAAQKKRAKPGPKPKQPQPPKPRAKPGPKPKPRDQDGNIIRPSPVSRKPSNKQSAAPSRAVSNAATASRSRSTSVLPSTAPDQAPEPESEQPDKDDDKDKLYCVCNTKCDEWYHTQCVDIPDHQVDLIDQFFCPPCISKNPNADLKTTYKTRCRNGLEHPDSTSSKACHKPARAFSKYCSPECGYQFISKRIDTFAKNGGNKEELWHAVKNAEERQGLVKCVKEDGSVEVIAPTKGVKQKEGDRLDKLLDDITKMREEIVRSMDIIMWREKLINLASDRAERLKQCGWDQRLCFSDEDWAEYGEGVLGTYEDQAMEVDEEGEWWCPGEMECERHAGWPSLRMKELDKERDCKEAALYKLSSKEREIRKRIEDILSDPVNRDNDQALEPEPVQKRPANTSKGKTNGDAPKKGRKRKVPS
ncbi:COMPASS (complex proteins associated with Set1p) component [Stygiomarasmius scandens]|uniref:COMPASS (Complex proteins associated with Set1p) component n=1 Tax=Marasmiellus scandens TaxID=2682957 RepID=A0ABR1JR23_9AGAR